METTSYKEVKAVLDMLYYKSAGANIEKIANVGDLMTIYDDLTTIAEDLNIDTKFIKDAATKNPTVDTFKPLLTELSTQVSGVLISSMKEIGKEIG